MIDWNEWGNLIAISILCLSPVVAWIEYFTRTGKELKFENVLTFNTLKSLESEVKEISNWTGVEEGYKNDHFSLNWYNPSKRVYDLQDENIESYIYTFRRSRKYKNLNKALLSLGDSIRNFRKKLQDHKAYTESMELNGGPVFGGLYSAYTRAMQSQAMKAEYNSFSREFDILDNQKIDKQFFTDEQKYLLKDIYEYNRKLHIDAIGNANRPKSLFYNRLKVEQLIEGAIKDINKQTIMGIMIGHTFATIFFVVGILYMGLFFSRALFALYLYFFL